MFKLNKKELIKIAHSKKLYNVNNTWYKKDIVNLLREKQFITNKELREYLESPLWCSENEEDIKKLETYYNERLEFLNRLTIIENGHFNLDFLDNFYNIFHIDTDCLCQDLVKGKKDGIFRIGRVFGKPGKIGIASELEIHKKDLGETETLIVKSVGNARVFSFIEVKTFKIFPTDYVNIMNPSITENLWNNDTLLYAPLNGFANQTIQHMIISLILDSTRYSNNYVYQYDAFYCGNAGYNIMKKSFYGDLSNYLDKSVNVTPKLMENISHQVLGPLLLLKNKKYGFVHADLKARNVFVTRNEAEEPVFQLADFDKSSIFFNGIKFYNSDADIRIKNYVGRTIMSQNKEKTEWYILDDTGITIKGYLHSQIMHSPFGFYLSFDIYTFMLSLLMEPKIYYAFMNGKLIDSLFIKIWRSMWISDYEYSSIMELITTEHQILLKSKNVEEQISKMRSISTYMYILSSYKFHLRYDLDWLHDLLQIPKQENDLNNKKIKISLGGHVCTSSCDNGKCYTGLYTGKLNFEYNYDYCN